MKSLIANPAKRSGSVNTFADSIATRMTGSGWGNSAARTSRSGAQTLRGPDEAVKTAGGDSANLGNPDAEKESRIRRGEYRGAGGYLLRDGGLTCRRSTSCGRAETDSMMIPEPQVRNIKQQGHASISTF